MKKLHLIIILLLSISTIAQTVTDLNNKNNLKKRINLCGKDD